MKGLLIKDLLLLKQMGAQYLLIVGIFAFVSLMSKSSVLFASLISLLPIFIVTNLFTLEGAFPSDMLVLSLPPGRKRVVLSRYLLVLLSIFCFALFGMVLFFIGGMKLYDGMLAMGASMCAVIVLVSVLIPAIIKLGVVKGRFVMMFMGMLPMALPLLTTAGVPVLDLLASPLWLPAMPVAALLLFACSVWISVRIYSKKEI